MKKLLVCVLAAASMLSAAPKKPKLVLFLVFDQFRYDYLTRFRPEYTGGFDRLLRHGAVFTNARLIHFPSVTAVGHSTFLTGATPSVSGIVGNDWYDREEGKQVTSVSDGATQSLGGGPGPSASPRRLLVDTVGDELKLADHGKSRVLGISLKDRAAILPVGHLADAAYWFDTKTGNFVSSTYYFADLPAWTKDFNAARPADQYRNTPWLDYKMPDGGPNLYRALDVSPFGNELVERFAERAIEAEQLGHHEATDLLSVSFSCNDYVGHKYGPYSPEAHDVTVRTDGYLERLLATVDRQIGLDNVLVIMTADHGAAPVPKQDGMSKMPGGRISEGSVRQVVQAALVNKYGEGDWVLSTSDLLFYLNRDLMAKKNLDGAEVRRTAAQAAFAVPHMLRVYTSDQLASGQAVGDEMSRLMMNGFNARRSPDVACVPEPYWVAAKTGTSHGTPYSYDTHVPLIFMGLGIRAGRYDASIAVNDIAPTLATMLDVETPSGSVGRVLTEILVP